MHIPADLLRPPQSQGRNRRKENAQWSHQHCRRPLVRQATIMVSKRWESMMQATFCHFQRCTHWHFFYRSVILQWDVWEKIVIRDWEIQKYSMSTTRTYESRAKVMSLVIRLEQRAMRIRNKNQCKPHNCSHPRLPNHVLRPSEKGGPVTWEILVISYLVHKKYVKCLPWSQLHVHPWDRVWIVRPVTRVQL